MLNKEEIEKAKEKLNNPKKEDLIEIIRMFKQNGIENYCIAKNETMETLLQYIDQLEADNYELNNRLNEFIEDDKKQNKIIDEMSKFILKITNREESELNIEREKQHFRKKVEENENENELY